MQEDIKTLRLAIDRIDRQIAELLEQRMDVVSGIYGYKKAKGLPILDRSREAQKIESLRELFRAETYPFGAQCFQGVMDACRSFQEKKLADEEKPARYGLLGRKLGHSFSPYLHRKFGGYEYALFEREPEQLEDFLKNGGFTAINVTIPYKKAVLPYLDEVSETAKRIGSVNCVVRRADGTLYGDNSDYFGLKYSIEKHNIDLQGKKVIILGDGGAAAMVRVLAADLGAARVVTISRHGEDNYDNLEKNRAADVIINTTPVGMFPENGVSVVDPTYFTNCKVVIDLIFNPAKTKLLLLAEQAGMLAVNGLEMLTAQAARACEVFTDATIAREKIDEVYDDIAARTTSIVLIGMPGSGKSSVARAIGSLTGREVVDSDVEIEKRTGRTPKEIILADGEDAFRKIETEVLADLTKQPGILLSCGGGVVVRPENEALLKQNGRIYYLKRPLENLAVAGRPLSEQQSVQTLYEKRRALYEAFADATVDNVTTIEEAAQTIVNLHFAR